jgi:hypothetical protein
VFGEIFLRKYYTVFEHGGGITTTTTSSSGSGSGEGGSASTDPGSSPRVGFGCAVGMCQSEGAFGSRQRSSGITVLTGQDDDTPEG